MPGSIFISYRHEDSAGWAGWLRERLLQKLAPHQVFIDIQNIEPGLDFTEVLDKYLQDCDSLLAVIGRSWTHCKDKRGVRRIEDPDDFVRLEIATALERRVRVVPILVDGATMPGAEELPDALKPLARRQGFEISLNRFETDVDRLAPVLAQILDEREKGRKQPAPVHANVRADPATPAAAEAPKSRPPGPAEAEPARAAAERRGLASRPVMIVGMGAALALGIGLLAFVTLSHGDKEQATSAQAASQAAPSIGDSNVIAKCDSLAASPFDTERPSGVLGIKSSELDKNAALDACKLAAAQFPDNPRMQFEYGRVLELNGDYDEAMKSYGKAVNQDYAAALSNVAGLYQNGNGVIKNSEIAISLYSKAAARGNPAAQYNLGLIYQHGLNGQKDEAAAFRWYEMAATQGFAPGQFALGKMYLDGKGGVKADKDQAAVWFNKAADQGLEQAKAALEKLKTP